MGGGALTSLTSYFGSNLINDLRGYVSTDHRDGEGYLALPQGRVQVASNASDTTRGVTTFSFGGSAGFPQSTDNTGLELSDELSWLPGSTAHRVKLGGLVNAAHFQQIQTPNAFGTFTYPSLGALEAQQPSQYTRNLSPLEQAGTAWNGAAYLGDVWRRNGGLQLTYGVRLESSSFSGAPAYNAVLDSAFGIRTDRVPSEIRLSPRAGFTWIVGGGNGGGGRAGFGGSTTMVRGGFGEFKSPTPTSLYSSALAAPGLSTAESRLVCIGSAVPIPDWAGYLQDGTTIPAHCESGDDRGDHPDPKRYGLRSSLHLAARLARLARDPTPVPRHSERVGRCELRSGGESVRISRSQSRLLPPLHPSSRG
jgi:hypothetical protein